MTLTERLNKVQAEAEALVIRFDKVNSCHNPPGSSSGGQFCSEGGGGVGIKALNYKGIGRVTFGPQGSVDEHEWQTNKDAIDSVLASLPKSVTSDMKALLTTGGDFLGTSYIPKHPKPNYVSDEIMLGDDWRKKTPELKRHTLAHEFGHRAQLTTHPQLFKDFQRQELASLQHLQEIFPNHWMNYIRDRKGKDRKLRIQGEVLRRELRPSLSRNPTGVVGVAGVLVEAIPLKNHGTHHSSLHQARD